MGGCYSKLHKKDGQVPRNIERRKPRPDTMSPKSASKGSIPPKATPEASVSSGPTRSLTVTPRKDKKQADGRPSSAPNSVINSNISSQRRSKVSASSSPSVPSSTSTVVPSKTRRSPSASLSSSAASTPRPASKLRPPSQTPTRTSSRPHRSRSGNREHPYSRQPKSDPEESDKQVTARQAVRELHKMAETDTYRAFKVTRRGYIAAPRSCDDNYNAENYTKRLSSETATSSSSDRTLVSVTSMEEANSASGKAAVAAVSPTSPDSAIDSQTAAPTPVTDAVMSGSGSVDDSVASTTSGYCSAPSAEASEAVRDDPPSVAESPALPLDSATGSSTSTEKTISQITESTSSLNIEGTPSLAQSTSSMVQRRSTCDLSAPVGGRTAALSVSSLNSDDLMLTTDVGLDLEDDDIIKDIDDTEKEDPFVVANALATGRNEGGGGKGSGKNNLTTPETISSAMTLVQQASKTGGAPSGIPSPRVGLMRKKSTPATPSGDSPAKVSVLRRIRAQSNVERPRSFSSPLRPPSRQRGQSSVEGEEVPVLMSQPDFRHISHDMRSVKLLLLRLKGMLLEDEGHQPIFAEQMSSSFYGQSNLSTSNSSIKRSDSLSEPSTPLTGTDPFSPNGEEPLADLDSAPREALIQEVLSLRRTTALLRTKLAEKETTVKLLQQQMTKNVCSGGPVETPPSLDSLRSFIRHPFPGKPLSFDSSGGTEPSSPVVVDPVCPLAASVIAEAASAAASLPNGDAIGLSPRPSLGPRLKSSAARRERGGGARPSFLPVTSSQQGKRSISTGHLPHRKTTPLTSTNSQH